MMAPGVTSLRPHVCSRFPNVGTGAPHEMTNDVTKRVSTNCPLCQNLVSKEPRVMDLGPISGFEDVSSGCWWRHEMTDDVTERVLTYCPMCHNLVKIGPRVKDLGPISGFEDISSGCWWRHEMTDDVTKRVSTNCPLCQNLVWAYSCPRHTPGGIPPEILDRDMSAFDGLWYHAWPVCTQDIVSCRICLGGY